MASNVRAFPMTVMPPQPPQPSQQDWVWDGSNWCPPCGGQPAPMPPPCPPPGWPTPCPPWFPPPAGQAPWYPGANGGVSFSATAPLNPIRGNLWWDGTMLHLFDGAAWEDIGPSVGGTVKGVTDGSSAAPGFVGEVIRQTTNGTLSVIPPPGSPATTFAALVVPPGDWNIQGTLAINNLTNGVFYDEIGFNILSGSNTLATYNINGGFLAGSGITGGDYSCAVFALSTAAAVTLTGSVTIQAIVGGASGTAGYQFSCQGRRMR